MMGKGLLVCLSVITVGAIQVAERAGKVVVPDFSDFGSVPYLQQHFEEHGVEWSRAKLQQEEPQVGRSGIPDYFDYSEFLENLPYLRNHRVPGLAGRQSEHLIDLPDDLQEQQDALLQGDRGEDTFSHDIEVDPSTGWPWYMATIPPGDFYDCLFLYFSCTDYETPGWPGNKLACMNLFDYCITYTESNKTGDEGPFIAKIPVSSEIIISAPKPEKPPIIFSPSSDTSSEAQEISSSISTESSSSTSSISGSSSSLINESPNSPTSQLSTNPTENTSSSPSTVSTTEEIGIGMENSDTSASTISSSSESSAAISPEIGTPMASSVPELSTQLSTSTTENNNDNNEGFSEDTDSIDNLQPGNEINGSDSPNENEVSDNVGISDSENDSELPQNESDVTDVSNNEMSSSGTTDTSESQNQDISDNDESIGSLNSDNESQNQPDAIDNDTNDASDSQSGSDDSETTASEITDVDSQDEIDTSENTNDSETTTSEITNVDSQDETHTSENTDDSETTASEITNVHSQDEIDTAENDDEPSISNEISSSEGEGIETVADDNSQDPASSQIGVDAENTDENGQQDAEDVNSDNISESDVSTESSSSVSSSISTSAPTPVTEATPLSTASSTSDPVPTTVITTAIAEPSTVPLTTTTTTESSTSVAVTTSTTVAPTVQPSPTTVSSTSASTAPPTTKRSTVDAVESNAGIAGLGLPTPKPGTVLGLPTPKPGASLGRPTQKPGASLGPPTPKPGTPSGLPTSTKEPASCQDLFILKGIKESGIYSIHVGGDDIEVFCDMDAYEGGWTVLHRRGDFGGSNKTFLRRWEAYKNGFGKPGAEHWVGLKYWNNITLTQPQQLLIDMEDWDGNTTQVAVNNFIIGTEFYKFRIIYASVDGEFGESLPKKGTKFSTQDNDNDAWRNNCAARFQGAWWYSACHNSNLNGLYLRGEHESFGNGVNWYHWRGYHYSLKSASMKVRPQSRAISLGFKKL